MVYYYYLGSLTNYSNINLLNKTQYYMLVFLYIFFKTINILPPGFIYIGKKNIFSTDKEWPVLNSKQHISMILILKPTKQLSNCTSKNSFAILKCKLTTATFVYAATWFPVSNACPGWSSIILASTVTRFRLQFQRRNKHAMGIISQKSKHLLLLT